MGKITKNNIINSDSRYRGWKMTTDTESEPCSGRDSLPGTHHDRLPPGAGAACCAPLIRNAFGRSKSRNTTLTSWMVHRRLSHKLSHPQFVLRGIHCRKGVIPRPPPQDLGDLPNRSLRLLGAGKPDPIACRPTQLLRSGSQGRQSRDRRRSLAGADSVSAKHC